MKKQMTKKQVSLGLATISSIIILVVLYLLSAEGHLKVSFYKLILPAMLVGGAFGYGLGLFIYYLNPQVLDVEVGKAFKLSRWWPTLAFGIGVVIMFHYVPAITKVLLFIFFVTYLGLSIFRLIFNRKKNDRPEPESH